MSLSSDAMRRLGAAGLTIDQIATVVEVIEDAQSVKRAQSAERVRRHRETKKSVTKDDVTLCNVTERYTPPLSSPPSLSPEPPNLTPPIIPPTTTPEEARERDEVRVPPADGMWTKAHYDHLEAACLEAIGPAANQTTAGLKNLAPVHAWLNSGADLYADIIPTLRGRASSMQPGTVRSWVFFTDAVLEAKTRRLAPAPVFLPSRPPAQNRDPYRKRLTDEEILAAASNNRVAK